MMAAKGTRTMPRGFSLLEVVISIFLVGTIMVVALETLTASTSGRARNGRQAQATQLANMLLQEIIDQPYLEPDDTADFGPETGETTDSTRAAFDDVDDYDEWSASPPQDKDGADLPLSTDWNRKVAVRWVQPNSLDLDSPQDAGLKEVVVTVEYKGAAMAQLSMVLSESRQVLPTQGP